MKYIKKFDTTTQYNNAALDLPNVSLTMDDREVHYNPYDVRLVTKYNVPSTSSATRILYDSSNISSIEIDGTTLNSVTTSYTFSTTGTNTVKYTLTDNTSISDSTFMGCSRLTCVTIPRSVTSIGINTLSNCSMLESITVASDNTSYDSRDNCNAIIETASNTLIVGCKNTIIPNSVTSIGGGAFNGSSSLTTITIPNSVTSISDAAFAGCSGMTSLTIGNSVTSIGGSAFWDCSGLTSVTIPNSVTSIGDQAFYRCTGLQSVTIGNSVTSIGANAFNSCSNLRNLIIQATTPPTLGSGALGDTNGSLAIKVPSASVNAYKAASGWSSYSSRIQAI